MTADTILFLAQDGITNGTIYALLGLALVLVFAVTRIILIPQGEFVVFGALTLAGIQANVVPGTVWLLLAIGFYNAVVAGGLSAAGGNLAAGLRAGAAQLAVPSAVTLAAIALAPLRLPLLAQIALTLLIVVPLGPHLYRAVFRPIADAPVLVLLIVAVALHLALLGISLLVFGAEGSRTEVITDLSLDLGMLSVPAQTLWILGASVALIVGLYVFFECTLYGKALRATAINRVGAKIVGIRIETAGSLCLTLAAGIGALSGILISPVTTIYYDSGLLFGLKGLVAATIGGFVSYPLSAIGALIIGIIEAFSSFYTSAYKEAIVFALIVPVLLVRSLTSKAHGGDDE